MDILSAATMLFLIMDPLGNLPIVLSILKHIDPKRRRKVLIRELIFALLILMLFLFAGQSILSFLHVQPETLSISGGIILFIIAIKMIFPSAGSITGLAAGEEPFIVPMAIPMIAGPSVIAAVASAFFPASRQTGRTLSVGGDCVGRDLLYFDVLWLFQSSVGRTRSESGGTLNGLVIGDDFHPDVPRWCEKLFGINQRQQKAAPVSGFSL